MREHKAHSVRADRLSATTIAAEPVLIDQPPPPVRRDRMVWAWIIAMTVSWFGDALWTVALAWTAAHTLPAALAGAVLGVELLPQAALVLLGGVLADRVDTRKVLVAGQVGQGHGAPLRRARLAVRAS